jgi:dipeptidyl aminopeptidase/acylaminoacyl peptidase
MTCRQYRIIRLLLILAASAPLLVPDKAVPGTQHSNQQDGTIEKDNLRPFTVADSIAMTHFEVPNEASLEDAPISPDGKKFFVITERGILDENQREYSLSAYDLANVDKPLFTIKFNTSSNRPGISQAEWLNDRTISLLGEHPGGLPQVYVVDVITGKQYKLTSNDLGVRSYALSKNEKKLLYYGLKAAREPDNKYKEDHGFAVTEETLFDLVSGSWRQPERLSNLHIQDLPSGTIRVLPAQSIIRETPPIWLSPDGHYAITEQLPETVPAEWGSYEDASVKRYVHDWLAQKIKPDDVFETAIVNTETGKVRSLIGAPSSVGFITSAVWSGDSHSAVVAATLLPLNSDDQAELSRRRAHAFVASVNIGAGSIDKLMEIQKGQWIRIEPGTSPDTLRITEWKQENGDLISRMPIHIFHYRGARWTEDLVTEIKDHLPRITTRQSLDHWPVLVKVDPSTKSDMLIQDPNPDFNSLRFGRRKVIHWTDKLGQSLIGGLVYPTEYTSGTRYPLVIQTHGFSSEQFLLDGPFTTAMAAEELANKGIAVLQLPQSPLELADTCKRGGPAQSQIESAIDYLDNIGLIDRNRVGLVGFSITGFNVRQALVNSNYRFAAATSAEGNDWGYWTYVVGGNWGAWMSQSECAYGGPPWDNNWDRWFKDSISFHYDRIHAPLRLESDSNENWAGVLNEWENFIALKRLHKPVELIYVPHGSHPVVKPLDRLTSQQGNVDWMVFWLKGEEDPDPSKAEQYARWHELQKLQQAENEKLGDENRSN